MANILLVDSQPPHRTGLKRHLESLGFEVMATGRGDEGIALAKAFNPQLILLDHYLPDMTGFQFCTKLRVAPKTQGIPIVLLSSLAGYDNQRGFAMDRGANGIISKPVKLVEIGDVVDGFFPNRTKAAAPDATDLSKELLPDSEFRKQANS
jgi:CheY-like chemotaxis protein